MRLKNSSMWSSTYFVYALMPPYPFRIFSLETKKTNKPQTYKHISASYISQFNHSFVISKDK